MERRQKEKLLEETLLKETEEDPARKLLKDTSCCLISLICSYYLVENLGAIPWAVYAVRKIIIGN